MFSPRGETRLEPGLRSAWNFLEDSLKIPFDDIEIGIARRILRRGSGIVHIEPEEPARWSGPQPVARKRRLWTLRE
jgi:hypothetical protein